MKNIWIFGTGKTDIKSRYNINQFEVAGETFVKYWSHSQMKNDMNLLEGFQRPHVIINTSKPFPELEKRQKCIPREVILDLY